MSFDQLVKVEVHGNVAVRQDHIALFLVLQPVQNAGQCIHTAAVQLDAALCKRRNNVQASALAGQVPFTACAQVVHQGMIVFTDDDRNIIHTGVCHVISNRRCPDSCELFIHLCIFIAEAVDLLL